MDHSVRKAEWTTGVVVLPDGWRQTTVGEFCTYYKGGTPFEKLEYSTDGIPVLAKGDIKPFGILEHSETRFVAPQLAEERGFYLTQPGDFLMTTRDLTQAGDVLGLMARVPEDQHYLVNQGVNVVRLSESVDWRFVVYWTNGPVYRAHMKAHAVGSTQIHIRKDAFIEAPLWLPPREEQGRIASVLSALDEKVAINRRICRTLEAIGRALFKSWFVDFDPVRHQSSVGAPPRPFPSDLDPIEEVPRGWRRRPLREWADALSGGTPSKTDRTLWGGDIPWISPKVMNDIHADEADQHVTAAAIGNGTRLAPPGTTLVMVRGMGLHHEVRVSQTRREVTFNQDVKALVPRGIQPSLLLFALLNGQQELLGKVESSGHGTGKLPSEILLAHPIAMPPPDQQAELAKRFDLINERIAAARDEVRTLTSLRDLLLPRLLCGEVRVGGIKGATAEEA